MAKFEAAHALELRECWIGAGIPKVRYEFTGPITITWSVSSFEGQGCYAL